MNQNYDCFNLDPEEKYPSEGPLKVEKNAERVLALLRMSTVESTTDQG